MLEELVLSTSNKNEFMDITEKVRRIVQKEKVQEGKVLLFVPHTTAAVTINENADPDVKRDMTRALNRMVPEDEEYAHGEGNSPAHVKASILGMSETVLIHNGKLLLGTWQGIFFSEFDGPRNRKIMIRVESL